MKKERIPYKGTTLLPVKKDLVFKALFSKEDSLDLLASLLSAILDLELDAKDLTLANTELSPEHESGKLARLDVRVKTSDGKEINIEIQLHDGKNIEKRSIFYLSKLYTDQMISGMKFRDIRPAVAINILDYDFLPFEEYHNCYRMRNRSNNHELTDVFEVNFIELHKVPTIGHTGNMKDLWMQFLTADTEEVLEMLKEQNPILEKAMDRLVYISADEQLRYELDMREKAELDYLSDLAESREEGETKERQKIAKNLKRLGMKAAQIVEATGLSVDEIEKL